jgi:hypothetical protein
MWDLTIPGNDDHDFYIDTLVAGLAVLIAACTRGSREAIARSPGRPGG